jgi:transcription elongation GreA/GreB family factor
MNTKELKLALLQECSRIIDERFHRIKKSISDIETSLYEESKSSAGDKHETERAMLQIERENAGKQLIEVEKVQQILHRIDVNLSSEFAHLGSLVYTTHGNYLISVSIGALEIDSINYFAVAPDSPIGHLLIGKKEGERFSFNDREYELTKLR